jgi:hypothetical protein
MHARDILCRCLEEVLGPMHARRRHVLLQALQALIDGRRLTLTDLSRSWPDATFSHAPLKAVDRLLSNPHIHRSILPLSRAMSAWLLKGPSPVLVVDWVDLRRDGCWCALRAAMPVGGRTVTVYERIYPIKQINSPVAERAFLALLAQVVPEGVRPIVVTDAGFRSGWFRAVAGYGWDYIGRVRNNVKVRNATDTDWRACATLHAGASRRAEDLGAYRIVQAEPLSCRLIRVRRQRKHRDQLTQAGQPQQGTAARKARKAAREPWLLATSLPPERSHAVQVVLLYGKRMQIEESFRDLKSHRFGMGFEDSQTRDERRLSVLLLLNMLAGFVAWLLGLALKRCTVNHDPMAARPSLRQRYSVFRRSIEWLRLRCWPPPLVEAVSMLVIGSTEAG